MAFPFGLLLFEGQVGLNIIPRISQAERKKYREKLELRTYHEIYVLDSDAEFVYLNCHPETGILPFFEIQECAF